MEEQIVTVEWAWKRRPAPHVSSHGGGAIRVHFAHIVFILM